MVAVGAALLVWSTKRRMRTKGCGVREREKESERVSVLAERVAVRLLTSLEG